MSKVSIVVPAYNAEKYLDRCIESILKQDYIDFELILVNDGSKDSTGEICDRYANKDKRVRAIHKENGGVSEARNVGLDNADGKYVMFVDGDDCIAEDMLSHMIGKIGDSSDMVVASVKMITKTYDTDYTMKNAEQSSKELLEEFCVESFPRICLCAPWCKLYKKEIIESHCIRFDKNMSLGEDTTFNMTYLRHCKKIATTDRTLYFYMRDNEESLFSRFRDNWYRDTLRTHEVTVNVIEELKCSQQAVDLYTASYVKNLIATLVVAVRTANLKQCVLYMKNIADNETFRKNIHVLSNEKLMYITAKLIKMRFYPVVYLFLRIRYKK